MELIPSNTKIDFIKYRNPCMLGSLAVVVIGLVAMFAQGGPNLGIDFAGGSLVQVRIKQNPNIGEVRSALTGIDAGSDAVQQVGPDEFLIRVAMKGERTVSEGERQQAPIDPAGAVTGALGGKLGKDNVEVLKTETVGPRVGQELRSKAIVAVSLATILMGLYIAFRFEWRFGVGAAVALFHDVLVTVAGLVVFGYEFDLTIVAALLTIVGFSVNDTVVVSDRIRENMRKDRRAPLAEIINRSINETLSRTILTSGTAITTVLALYLIGGPVIHGFAFSLLVGFIAGVYSSVYIAAPIVLVFEKGRGPRPAPAVEAKSEKRKEAKSAANKDARLARTA
jgi:preprotein translocase subunit SecF